MHGGRRHGRSHPSIDIAPPTDRCRDVVVCDAGARRMRMHTPSQMEENSSKPTRGPPPAATRRPAPLPSTSRLGSLPFWQRDRSLGQGQPSAAAHLAGATSDAHPSSHARSSGVRTYVSNLAERNGEPRGSSTGMRRAACSGWTYTYGGGQEEEGETSRQGVEDKTRGRTYITYGDVRLRLARVVSTYLIIDASLLIEEQRGLNGSILL